MEYRFPLWPIHGIGGAVFLDGAVIDDDVLGLTLRLRRRDSCHRVHRTEWIIGGIWNRGLRWLLRLLDLKSGRCDDTTLAIVCTRSRAASRGCTALFQAEARLQLADVSTAGFLVAQWLFLPIADKQCDEGTTV